MGSVGTPRSERGGGTGREAAEARCATRPMLANRTVCEEGQHAAMPALHRIAREAGWPRWRDVALPPPHLSPHCHHAYGHAVRGTALAAGGHRHVRWYLRSRLSAADVRDLRAERGVDVSARTIPYRVQRFAPLLARAGRRAAARPGARWWCDETYVRVGGTWAYRYRALDERGQVVDVPLRRHRDLDCARACFVLATYRRRATPEEVVTDRHCQDNWSASWLAWCAILGA